MRSLATIQTIASLSPIPNADAIEVARVMGWDVVVKRGEFSEREPCVFFEVDSVLPDGAPWAEFMRPRRFRVKTVKLRGQLSQGLALPTSIIPADHLLALLVEDDVTELLGVKKYEPPMPGADRPDIGGHFPTRVPKTDETRIQSCLSCLGEMRGRPWVATVKLDGASATYARLDGAFTVASRNWSLNEGPGVYWDIARRYDLANALPDGFAIQGEIAGPGIQKNRLMLREPDLFVFNVYDIRAGRYLNHLDAAAFTFRCGLCPVQTDGTGNAFDVSLEELLELAKGTYPGTKNRREGIVVRPLEETYSDRLGGRLSFKVLNNDFLLKDEE